MHKAVQASVLILMAGLLVAMPARSQGVDGVVHAQDKSVYPAAYFSAAAPANAHEMVLRLPGFAIIEADEDVRGYAGAQGNVLIDGAPPASKREDIVELLRRIPADSVAHIDIIRSGASGFDMAGHALLANVVRSASAVSELALEAGVATSTAGWVAPRAQLEYGRHWDERALELALALTPELDDDSGRGRILTFSPEGAPGDTFSTETHTVKDLFDATASWRQPLAGGSLALHSALRGERVRASEEILGTSAERVEIVQEHEDFDEAELGLRFVRSLGERSTLEATASQQLGWLQASSRAVEDDTEERFDQRTDTGESLARFNLTREQSSRLSLNADLEAAVNFLQSNSRLIEDDAVVALPGSDIRIEEQRVQGSLGATWRAHPQWVVESGLSMETSRLDQTGDSPLSRSFIYIKPRLSVAWERDELQQWRLSLSREVGQLDFEDFVASASLDTGVVTAGNAALEPDKTWRAALSWERKFGENGAVVATFTHDRISDVIDRVPVVTDDDVFDAPGNIGDGTRDSLAVETGTSLQRLGAPNLHVSASLLWQRSRVRDPTTGEIRAISEQIPLQGEFGLTHSLPARGLSWGLDFTLASEETQYGIDEIATEREGHSWTLFAEQRVGSDWRLRAEVSDLGGQRYSKDRVKYDGLRSQVPVAELEQRSHRYPGQVLLTLRRSLGGD